MKIAVRAGSRPRELVAICVLGVALLGLEAIGFAAGGSATIAVTALLVIIAVLIIARVTIRSMAMGSVILAAFTLPWNGWQLGPVRLGDLFLLLALMLFVALDIGSEVPRLPWWVQQVGFVTLLVIVLHELIPTNPRFLAHRVILDAVGRPFVELLPGIAQGPKLIVAVVATAWVFCFAVQHDPRALYRLAVAYAAGSALSGYIAFSDGRGLTHLGQTLTGNATELSREGGLSDHPNFLAASCVLSISLTIWVFAKPETRNKVLGSVLFLGVMLGVYASGSRGGAVCAVLALVGSVVITPQFRRHLATFAFVGGLLVAVSFVVYPQVGAAVLRATRLTSSSSTVGSNAIRSAVGDQAVRDFVHSPIDGIGFQVAAEAQNVYLQQLASGGILIFASMAVYLIAGLYYAARLMRVHDLAGPLFVSILAGAALNYVGASLTDRYNYVPNAILVALVMYCASRAARQEQVLDPASDRIIASNPRATADEGMHR